MKQKCHRDTFVEGQILDGGGATSDPAGALGGATGALRCKSGLHSLVGMFSVLGMQHAIVEALAHFGVVVRS